MSADVFVVELRRNSESEWQYMGLTARWHEVVDLIRENRELGWTKYRWRRD